ncbi:MAG TPA: NAD(P)/FAD-dependent oxidoreductase [Candidatus Limnocylindrales bacterium]
MKYDAIVIGAGHNGLVCAAYLGRAGLRTLVLEAREAVGGMADLALTVGRLSPTVARELGLRRHGLRLVQPEVRVFAPQPDGRGLTLWGDAALTARELADNPLVEGEDADRYATVDGELRAIARSLGPVLSRIPPDFSWTTTRAAMRAAAGVARSDERLWHFMPMAVRDLLEGWFESDALRAAVAARGLLYTALGPRMPGTSGVLLTDAASSNSGLAGQSVFARGGPAAVSAALADAVREDGGEIRTAARVIHVKRTGDRTTGVVLEGGEEVDANVVVSNLDPKTTLLDLLEPEAIGPRLSWRAANIRQAGATASVTFTLRALPVFPAAYDDGRRLRGRILIAPSTRYLDLAMRPSRYGASAEQPLLEMTIPSLVDESQLPSGAGQVARVVAQATAFEADAKAIGDVVTRTLDQFAPGFAELVTDRKVFTPRDIQREYGAAGGHPMHAEVALDQWFEWRPMHGLGGYRMPLDGLYLCGSGAHPGGGVTGAPGRLAAARIVGDLKKGRLKVAA